MMEVMNIPIKIAPLMRYNISKTVRILMVLMVKHLNKKADKLVQSVPSQKDTKPHGRILQNTTSAITSEIRADIVFCLATTKTYEVHSISSNDAKATRTQANEAAYADI